MGFEEQKEALQGLWGQTDKALQWLVEDDIAIMVWKGSRRARSFRLTPGSNGELVWGAGKFILDSAFAPGKQAAWLSGKDQSVAFTWDFVSLEGPPKEGAPTPSARRGRGGGRGAKKGGGKGKEEKGGGKGKGKGEGKGKGKGEGKGKEKGGGKGKGKGEGKGKGKGEVKGKGKGEVKGKGEGKGKGGKGKEEAKGKGEVKGKGKGEVKGAAKGAKGSGKSGKGKPQVFRPHVDKVDGVARTYEEMLLRYSQKHSRLDILAYFMDCEEETGKGSGKAKGEERRMDPADGKVYTWPELRAFYAPTYSKKQTEAYWEGCTPESKGMKGKGKALLKMNAGKGKAKGKPQSFVI